MKKIFLDANILISVLNKEYPGFTYSSRVLSLADDVRYQVFTSPLCLAIAFYFASKKHGEELARKKISLLADKLKQTTMNSETVRETVANKNIHDFEDGLQYYSALESGCNYIVTDDLNDFYFSKIEVLSGKAFLERHVIQK
jgi:predicted nucleic acid-binding protein